MNPRRRRLKVWLLLALVLLVVNLPVVHSAWLRSQVERDGVDVTAEVIDEREVGDDHFLAFRLPDQVAGQTLSDDDRSWTAQVDGSTYDEATRRRTVEVRVLPDRPAAYEVEGQVRSRAGLVVALGVDVLVGLMALLLWRFGSRLRPRLVLRATGDVERCAPGSLLERDEDDEYLVRGEVAEIDGDEVVLDLGDRQVLVHLDGHRNPVGYQQSAQVRGRMVG